MAEIKDCNGKQVKISKGSITIKSEDGKTSGVVKNITSLYDLQANRQMEYYQKIRKLGLHGKSALKIVLLKMVQCMFFATLKASYGMKNTALFQRKRNRRQRKRKQFTTQLERLELML